MPYAVTHVILTIIAVDLFRDYVLRNHKKYFTLHTVMVAGVGGLLPDIDIPLNWIAQAMGVSIPFLAHGGFTHLPIFALVFLIPGLFFWKQKKHKLATYMFVLSFGIIFHIFLDYFLGGGNGEGVMWLWPFSDAVFKLHLLHILGIANLTHALDAIILLAWLWHEETKHKILDFI
ncbi:metal-dependent hydrolase [Candidatus Woesearchaeota archaeon]|nr:metal-dependent hydrolase [Candidatus Woesearchaeota archaeon]